MERTVVALFDDLTTAERALQELLRKGFDRNDISVVRTNQTTASGAMTGGASMTERDMAATGADERSGAAAGAGIGAVLGGMAGLLVGLGALAIPGIGPIVAAGPLAAALGGAALGAAGGGIIGALTDAGIPENEAGYYAEGIRRGGTLLSVRAREDQVNRATQVLNEFSPVDIDQRATEWRSSGWTGFEPTSTSYSGTGYATTSRFEDFDKDFRNDWRTRHGSSGFGYERYQPAYRYGWEAHNRYQNREWSDVERELRSDWERNHPADAWEDFKDSVRTGWERFKHGVRDMTQDAGRSFDRMEDRMSESGEWDRGHTSSTEMSGASRTYAMYDRDFHSNWEQSYGNRGYTYDRYQPAYQYGYNLATENRYRSREWHEFEADARRNWESQHPNDRWEDFKDAVRHAWQRVRADVRDAVD